MKNSIKSQLLIVICSLSLAIVGSLFAASKEEAEVIRAQSRALLIFLDDTETDYFDPKNKIYISDFGAMTQKAASAIIERTGPILVSGSLLYNLFKDRSKQDKNYANERFQEFWQHCDMGDWVIKKITNKNISDADATEKDTPLFLLIHTRNIFISSFSAGQQDALEKDNSKITDLEFNIGLKMNHLEPIEAKSNEEFRDYITKLYVPKEKSRRQFALNTGANFGRALSSLFITKKEYKTAKKFVPNWVIYLNGHGDLNHSIASIGLADFPKLLNFFESQIKTKLFVYRSCYAAGFNTKKVFADLTSPIGKTMTYSYAIITNALTDAPVTTHGIVKEIDYLNTSVHYYQFLQEAESEEVNYAKAMSYISEAEKSIANIPQIRLPGMEWFSVLEEEKTVVSIGNILAHSRTTPLDIKKYFKMEDPRALLFYTRYVPFELVINDLSSFPALIPMTQSDYNENIGIGSYYLIDHITTDFPDLTLVRYLKRIELKSTTFVVKKITCNVTAAPNLNSVLENFYISYSDTYGEAPSISYTKISDAKGKEVITEGPAIADVEGKIKQVTEELGKQFKIGESKVSPIKEVIKKRLVK